MESSAWFGMVRPAKGLMLCKMPKSEDRRSKGGLYMPEPISAYSPVVEVIKSNSGEFDGKRVIFDKALFQLEDGIETFFAKEKDVIAVIED